MGTRTIKITVIKKFDMRELWRDENPGAAAELTPLCSKFKVGDAFFVEHFLDCLPVKLGSGNAVGCEPDIRNRRNSVHGQQVQEVLDAMVGMSYCPNFRHCSSSCVLP